jgi:CBS domain-containing protein
MSSPLVKFEPFNSLPEDVLGELSKHLSLQSYSKGTCVFNQGQPSLGKLFLIDSGLAEVIIKGEKGDSSVVSLRHPGQFFGETVLLSGKRYPASVKVVKDMTCFLLDREPFEQLLQSRKEFAGFFSHILTERLRDLYEEMVLEQPPESFGYGTEPFKQRVCDIMSSPVATCKANTPINEIARLLSVERISSVVVTGPNGKLLGIVSERDLISKVLALDCNPAVITARDIMEKNPPTLPPDAYFYQALLAMIKHQGKYILVVEQSLPIGIVTIGDLTRARSTNTLSVVSKIENSHSVDELVEASSYINKILASMLNDKAPASEICEVISEVNDLLTKRLLTLAEDQLAAEGLGHPPADYCWLTLGSGGRKEQTLASDQDNAIIIADYPPYQEQKVRTYFATLASFVVEKLEKCGFARCPGNLMATNPLWCQSMSTWKSTVHTWVYSPNPESSRQFTLFLDFRPVYGQDHLADELREFTLRLFRIAPTILHHMAKDDLQHRVPLSIFKQVLLEKNKEHKDQVDLKRAAGVHIVDCIRIFCMREGVSDTSTLSRLNKLVQIGSFQADDAEFIEAAYQSLMLFRLRENLRNLSLGQTPSNYINPNLLSKRQRSVLRESFLAIERLQTFTSSSFRVDGHL